MLTRRVAGTSTRRPSSERDEQVPVRDVPIAGVLGLSSSAFLSECSERLRDEAAFRATARDQGLHVRLVSLASALTPLRTAHIRRSRHGGLRPFWT
jgi:hypothetical protein